MRQAGYYSHYICTTLKEEIFDHERIHIFMRDLKNSFVSFFEHVTLLEQTIRF